MSSKVHKLILGESLTALTTETFSNEDLIVDLWEGGSVLYGWDLGNACIDRLPMVSKYKCSFTHKEVHTEFFEFKPSIQLIGTEKGFEDKIDLANVQVNWLKTIVKGGYVPLNGWCTLFRMLKSVVKVRRIYGEIKYILPSKNLIKISWIEGLIYEELINTMPIPYILDKIIWDEHKYERLKSKSRFEYTSLYVITLLTKLIKGTDEVKAILVGKKGLLSALIIMIPSNIIYKRLGSYLLVYVLAPLTMKNLRAELNTKILSEIKKLNVITNLNDIYFYRDYFEKYAFLGNINDEGKEVIHTLLDIYGIKLKGRLGTWKEKYLCCKF